MRLWHYGLGLSMLLGLGLGAGCAAGGKESPGGSGGATTTGAGGTGGSGAGTITTVADASADGFGECAKFNAEAKQAPAAMLILLQGSSSMNLANKWPAAQQAVIQAIDQGAFDTMSIGLMAWPDHPVTGPQCIFGLSVWCGTPGLEQVAIKPAGTQKSTDPTGVRHEIYQFLTTHTAVPESFDPGNATPLYDAMKNAYSRIKLVTGIEKRILVVITDGGGSCTSLSQPQRPNYPDGLGCPDWEVPDTLNAMIKQNQQDPATPTETFIIGVPGSNSHGESVPFPGGANKYDTAPYSMLLALSTYAVSGSPSTIDPACDSTLTYSKTGADPAYPCHIDLSNNANFNAGALAGAIANLRGKALGCVYDLPAPPAGETINPDQVNVVVTIDGTDYPIPKRASASDMCLTDPCWDYNSKGQVELIGITCSTVSTATSAKVEIFVGCATIIK